MCRFIFLLIIQWKIRLSELYNRTMHWHTYRQKRQADRQRERYKFILESILGQWWMNIPALIHSHNQKGLLFAVISLDTIDRTTWWSYKIWRWGQHQHHLIWGPKIPCGYRFLENNMIFFCWDKKIKNCGCMYSVLSFPCNSDN
jgi:hypothetical protein